MKAVEQLIEEFINVETINEKVNNINRGGCGIFAERLYHVLVKMGIKPNIIALVPDTGEFDKRIQGLDYMSYSGGIKHIILEVGGKAIDSNGLHNCINVLNKCYGNGDINTNLTIEKLTEFNNNHSQWNPRFDRNQIPNIENILNECYKRINYYLDK